MADNYLPAATSGTGAESDDAGMVIDTPSSETKAAQTALIPTEFFGDKELKPGTECTVKIERVLDGQVQVRYVKHGEEEAGEIEAPEPSGDEEMAGYMNE